ncbi:MAG: tetratricopeptide repeat protein [Candidatus Obscuribacterales bacterium]|nr:tetratricopeptide repeat protein [Candidatus Obscuribacterales bacterium]
MEKTIQLKTKLKAADCASYLNQFTSDNATDTKPLTGWVANQSFELAPAHAGFFSIQSIGSISEGSDGATVNLKFQMSRSSKTFLTITGCLIIGAFAALVPAYLQNMDVFGFSWAFLFLVIIPALFWLGAFFMIRKTARSKQDPFINTLCSSLQAQKVQTVTDNLPAIVLQRPKGKGIQSGKILSATWLALHAVPIIAGFGVANYLTDYLHNRAWSAWVGGNYAESENYCRPIMQLTELFFSADQNRQAFAYYILAENLRCQQKWDEALLYYNKAKSLQEKTLDIDSPTLAWTYDNIGKVYDAKNSPQAADYYNKAINIWKKSNPPNEALIARTLNRLAMFHAKQEDPAQLELAEEEQLDALSRDRTSSSEDSNASAAVAEDLNDLALIYFAEGKVADATKTITAAIHLKELKAISEANKISLATSYWNYAMLTSNSTTSEINFQKAEKLYRSVGIITTDHNLPTTMQLDKKMRPYIEYPNIDRRSNSRAEQVKALSKGFRQQ